MTKQDLAFFLACFEATRKSGGIAPDAFLMAHEAYTNGTKLLAQLGDTGTIEAVHPPVHRDTEVREVHTFKVPEQVIQAGRPRYQPENFKKAKGILEQD